MVNLLFISNNSKIENIKSILQPLLKVRIDNVGDFDFGLKDVFEKRPTLVFIQDQIAGVTGESVARHIQMLLGSGSPLFIYMHSGNLKAKPVKGLYDYLIDLLQDDTKVVTDILSALQSLLGSQWQNIYVPPENIESHNRATLTEPERKIDIDEILTDIDRSDLRDVTERLDNNRLMSESTAPAYSAENTPLLVSSTNEQLEEILATAASEPKKNETCLVINSDPEIEKVAINPETAPPSAGLAPEKKSQDAAIMTSRDSAVFSDSVSKNLSKTSENKSPQTVRTRSDIVVKPASPPVSPANFKIANERVTVDSKSYVSLHVVDADYFSKKSARNWSQSVVVVLVLCLLGGGWYVVKQKPNLLQSVIKTNVPVPESASKPQSVIPVPIVQKAVSSMHLHKPASLPSFIPLSGRDRTFASKKPGWERYVGTNSEFRVYRSNGKLKVVQIMATKNQVISESMLKTILIELVGTGEYHVSSIEQKTGFQVTRATVYRKADLLIYKKKSDVHALVVSLD